MLSCMHVYTVSFFFFNDTATTEIYTLSLHDALPIYAHRLVERPCAGGQRVLLPDAVVGPKTARVCTVRPDRKSTRLNSSHGYISYAVFCLKKKNTYLLL